ncbi:MAG: hypothetical protein J6U82_06755 [Alistipes sp.]|nr:hypothetical protein [Alistipes sp.]
MKIIRFKMCAGRINKGTESNPVWEDLLENTAIRCLDEYFEENMKIAQSEAVGEITVEEVEEPETEPTQLDQIEAQVTYTAMMTDTLLEE